jgi:hypothetical protein
MARCFDVSVQLSLYCGRWPEGELAGAGGPASVFIDRFGFGGFRVVALRVAASPSAALIAAASGGSASAAWGTLVGAPGTAAQAMVQRQWAGRSELLQRATTEDMLLPAATTPIHPATDEDSRSEYLSEREESPTHPRWRSNHIVAVALRCASRCYEGSVRLPRKRSASLTPRAASNFLSALRVLKSHWRSRL